MSIINYANNYTLDRNASIISYELLESEIYLFHKNILFGRNRIITDLLSIFYTFFMKNIFFIYKLRLCCDSFLYKLESNEMFLETMDLLKGEKPSRLSFYLIHIHHEISYISHLGMAN